MHNVRQGVNYSTILRSVKTKRRRTLQSIVFNVNRCNISNNIHTMTSPQLSLGQRRKVNIYINSRVSFTVFLHRMMVRQGTLYYRLLDSCILMSNTRIQKQVVRVYNLDN